MTSSMRPNTRRTPSRLGSPMSSVRNQRVPSGSVRKAGSLGRPRYPRATTGPLISIRPSSSVRHHTPGRGRPSYTQPPQVSLAPYVVMTGTPVARARSSRVGEVAAPPTSTASYDVSASTAAGPSSSSRLSCVGTSEVYRGRAPARSVSSSVATTKPLGENPSRRSMTTGDGVRKERAQQHLQPGDVLRGQGEQPGARAAEP